MAAQATKGDPPFDCPDLPSVKLQDLISSSAGVATQTLWLQYYMPQPLKIDSGIKLILSSNLSIQNSTGQHKLKSAHSQVNIESQTETKTKEDTNLNLDQLENETTNDEPESLQFQLCLATNLANKPKQKQEVTDKTQDNNNNDGNKGGGGDINYDDPFAGLDFENPAKDNKLLGQDKEINKQQPAKKDEKPFDPFSGPFAKGSHICDLPNNSKYRLILNKFPVWPNNLLMISKDWIDQTKFLNNDEFNMICKITQSVCLPKDNKNNDNNSNYITEHLIFLNSGDNSGGTLMHRHLHVLYGLGHLPLNIIAQYLKQKQLNDANNDKNESDEKKKDDKAVDNDKGIITFDEFDFIHGIYLLDENKWNNNKYNGKELCNIYNLLMDYIYEKCGMKQKIKQNKNGETVNISYNLLMNNRIIMIIPRKQANASQKYGNFTVNALPFSGLFFASSEDEMKLFKSNKDGKTICADVLKEVCFSK